MDHNKLNIILEKLNKISEKIDKLSDKYQEQETKSHELNSKLNNHINFVEGTYTWLLPSLQFIKNKVDTFNSKNYLAVTEYSSLINTNYISQFIWNISVLFLFYFVYINIWK